MSEDTICKSPAAEQGAASEALVLCDVVMLLQTAYDLCSSVHD